MKIKDGKVFLRDEVFTYLNKHGVATPWISPEAFLAPDQTDATDATDPTDPIP